MREGVCLNHFILTRFNLLLFIQDKERNKVRTTSWLEHRFALFERYCLPSIIGQTCQEFTWIVLFDSTTPEKFKEKIREYQKRCPQFVPVYVRPEGGRFFAQIFRDEVVKRLVSNDKHQEFENSRIDSTSKDSENSELTTDSKLSTLNSELKVLTTYLDNDDALNVRFVEDIQRRASELSDGTFITYDSGYQYFTDYKYVMQTHYPRNHFMSVVEKAGISVKTIYGYGSHYYIDKIEGVKIKHVKNLPMWCEVIHEKNMGNDAYFLMARMKCDSELLSRDFSIDEKVHAGLGLYLFKFVPRYIKTFVRRIGYFFFGRKW